MAKMKRVPPALKHGGYSAKARVVPNSDEDAPIRDCWEALTLAPMLVQLRSRGAIIEDSLLDWILAHCGPFSVD